MKLELKRTADGSWTLYRPEIDEPYHSVHGAMAESMHVFVQEGLLAVADRTLVRVLEVGFGTGLNAWLTWKQQPRPAVQYTAYEPYPLGLELVSLWNRHNRFLGIERLHSGPWNAWEAVDDTFALRKIEDKIEGLDQGGLVDRYDLVYHDAFAPEVQPELWTPNFFAHVYRIMRPGGVLVTYCAKGAVRRAMMEAGFDVERRPGPPGKREMLRCRVPEKRELPETR